MFFMSVTIDFQSFETRTPIKYLERQSLLVYLYSEWEAWPFPLECRKRWECIERYIFVVFRERDWTISSQSTVRPKPSDNRFTIIHHQDRILMLTQHCTMAQALKKSEIKDFVKNYYLCSHFLKLELFQMKIFGCYLLCSFTFNLYLGMS